MPIHFRSYCLALLLLVLSMAQSYGQSREESVVLQSTQVLREITANPATSIPTNMLRDAYGLVIIPQAIRGGFVIGARFGRGVLLVRDESGAWRAPVFVTLTGGNLGWQAGVQSTDLVMVFRTPRSVQGVMSGTFTLGAGASVAAGPVGREAAAATDGKLTAEILTYARSRGLFAGVAIDGSSIRIDSTANAAFYRAPAPGQPVVVPPSASQLVSLVWQLTQTAAPGATTAATTNPQVVQAPALTQQHAQDEAAVVRDGLTRSALELYKMMDPAWQQFLNLPPELLQVGAPHPSLAAVDASLQRFQMVATDPRYVALAQRPEFQSVYAQLQHYRQALAGGTQTLALPAPPAAP
jgi:lipid-binding SYLF domain-containing protein